MAAARVFREICGQEICGRELGEIRGDKAYPSPEIAAIGMLSL
jgi:hypothetical protein